MNENQEYFLCVCCDLEEPVLNSIIREECIV